MDRRLLVTVTIIGVLLLACSSHLPEKPITEAGFEIAAARAKLLGQEREKFDQHHLLKGENANSALQNLEREGYTCRIGYLDLLQPKKSDLAFETVRIPLLFCVQGSSDLNDICVERHVNLEVGWQDPNASKQELSSQLASSVILNRAFRCDERDVTKR